MPVITLPDSTEKKFDNPITVLEVAESIGPGLAKAAIAGKVEGKLVDVSYKISQDVALSIITAKDQDGLEVIRHSCAHLMAQAVQSLFPEAQVTIGPVIEDGFYYDFAYKRPFTPEDLVAIENKMQDIANQNLTVERTVMSRAAAIKLFEDKGEKYKVEIIKEIPGEEELSFYGQGDFLDLCRGPHVPNTACIKAFKLTKVAGAYWRGDSNNQMLQRIYGTAWADKKDLKAYMHRLEEAEKRDHRKLAKKYDLFHMQEEAPGMIFWHPNGWIIYQAIKDYIREKITRVGYMEINTPQVVDRRLWEKSGHWDKFRQNMYTLTSDDYHHAIKPMNCPCHVQVFNQGLRSYKELPYRLAEFGSCHRHEPSGTLHGLLRLRNFVQDDAHIFCTEEQIQDEVTNFNKLVFEVYSDFGFEDIIIRLATRPEERVGTDEMWDKAEQALEKSLESENLSFEVCPGEGAFYGPKIEFSLRDCIGRVWQCGTIQVDFSMPERLGAEYVAEDSSRRTPVMLHRAILGSIERFIGILIEESAGSFPVWLAPTQAILINITDTHADKCRELHKKLQDYGIRVGLDLRNEKIGFKIREHTIQRVPYLLVVGDREMDEDTISVRTREGEELGNMTAEELINMIEQNIAKLGRKTQLA